jgi:hypothetical protein
MPEVRIPLVGSFNTRGPHAAYNTAITLGKDQFFRNCMFDVVKNNVTQTANVYCSKLYGYTTGYVAGDGTYDLGYEVISSDFSGNTWVISSFAASPSSVDPSQATGSKILCMRPGVVGNTSMGIATGGVIHMTETIIGGVKTFLMTSTDGTGWFLAKDSITTNNTSINVAATFTANTTSGNAVLSNVSSFAGRYVGQALSGTGIAAGARILSMDTGGSTITMTANATANGTGITVTAERLAKIIDTDFPSDVIGPFACLGGFNFVMTENGRVYNSNLNSIISWTAGDYIPTNFYPDDGRGGVWVVSSRIAAISSGSFEWLYNAGNPSGSPLSASSELNFPIGGINSRSVCQIDGMFFWISSLQSGSCSVYTLNGFSPVELPSSQLSALLGSLLLSEGQPFPICMTSFKYGGKIYLLIGGSFAFDLENKIWSYWGVDNRLPHRTTGIYDTLGFQRTRGDIYGVSGSGSVNLFTTGSIIDGLAFGGNLIIRSQRSDLGTGNRKTVEYYELDSDVQSSGTATLEVSDDDFQTWTTIGTFDMTRVNPRIYRGGSWKGGRAHRLTHSANTPFRASTLTIKYGVGAH